MKKVLYIIFATLLFVYISAVLYYTRLKQPQTTCKKVEVVITDSLDKHFISEKGIVASLKKMNLYPLDKKSDEINTYEIEQGLLKNEIVETAKVIQLPTGNVRINISQKEPILRVFSTGGSYYVDKLGCIMPISFSQAIYVPVASGNIEKSFAMTDLYKFALYLQDNDFWNNQIEQIYVDSNKNVELVPRVGNQRIILGTLDNYDNKLEHLRLFYEQVIPKMGWEKYRVINLKYKNQIVCTKKVKL